MPGAVRTAAWMPVNGIAPPPRGEPLPARFAVRQHSQIAIKWRNATEAMRRDLAVLQSCRNEPDTCAGVPDALLSIDRAASSREDRARIGTINRAVNLAIKPSEDAARFGVPDRWTSPLETMRDARGDCEDYAIAKYALLRQAGFADPDLRLVIVRLPRARVDHAVLAVRHESRWLILDNRRFAMLDAEHFADGALFVLRGDGGADAPAMQADAGADFGAMPLVL